MRELENAIRQAVKDLFEADIEPALNRTDKQFGDYATNAALQLAKSLDKKPRDIAGVIAEKLAKLPEISKAEVAGPGFINLTLTDQALMTAIERPSALHYKNKKVVVEYSDPNPFKVLHAGHLYTSVVGDAIANLLEGAGAQVHRVNFGGDVGLHVGKTMWAILRNLGGENPEKLQAVDEADRAVWLSERYVEGNNAYEDGDEPARAAIRELNKRIYALHSANDHESALAQIYWSAREWSYDYFNAFYSRIGSSFEKYYPESETAPIGLKTVKEQLAAGVYEDSNGAVIFNGEKHGLHTRVFINSEGLPTYEAKDVGLIMAKWHDYHFDRSIIITGNDIVEYMKVVLKSIEQFAPDLANATTHLTHGIVKLAGGVKMSSRKGNILKAEDILDAASQANKQATGKSDERVTLGAVKYSFLKQRLGGDIIYNPEESVSLEGNSGPYLQYAYTRANSIIAKAGSIAGVSEIENLEPGERSLAGKLSEYNEVVELAAADLTPHHMCTYLYELAQTFNRFYENNQVIGGEREGVRLALVGLYMKKLKTGLELLGIPVIERM